MNTPEPGQWWLQADKQDRSDAKFFRVFFCGKDSKNRLIFEDADGNTEVDHGCDWSGWHHEPACTGWDWVPETFPQWYSYKNGPFESLNDPYLVRVESDVKQSFVHRSGKVDKVTYPYKPQELMENVRSGAWKKLSQQEADEALHPKKLLSPDVVKSPAEDPGEGYRFVNSDEVVLQTDERAYVYEDTEATGLIWGEVDKAVWFEVGKTASDLRRKIRARNVVFRRKAVNAATVTVYEVIYSDDLKVINHRFITSEIALERCKKRWKYVIVVSTRTVEVMLEGVSCNSPQRE